MTYVIRGAGITSILLLAACGQKGPLVLPDARIHTKAVEPFQPAPPPAPPNAKPVPPPNP